MKPTIEEELRGQIARLKAEIEVRDATTRHVVDHLEKIGYRAPETTRQLAAGLRAMLDKSAAKSESEPVILVPMLPGGPLPTSELARVLWEFACERVKQDQKWGQQNHPMLSTLERQAEDRAKAAGGDAGAGASSVMQIPRAEAAKMLVDELAKVRQLGYLDVALEEFCEVVEAAAQDYREGEVLQGRTRAELVQLGAVIAACVERIDRRVHELGIAPL